MPDKLETAARPRLGARGGAVKVVLPAKVAWDLDLFTKSLRTLAEKLGHSMCLSGLDITFGEEREFVVNPAGEVRGATEIAVGR